MDKPTWAELESELESVISRYSHRQALPWIEQDDLKQLMWLELWKAYQRWDPARGPLLPLWWRYWVNQRLNLMATFDRRKKITWHSLDSHAEEWMQETDRLMVRDPEPGEEVPPCPLDGELHQLVWELMAEGQSCRVGSRYLGITHQRWTRVRGALRAALSAG